jgi:hypothetical protein
MKGSSETMSLLYQLKNAMRVLLEKILCPFPGSLRLPSDCVGAAGQRQLPNTFRLLVAPRC